MENRNDLGKLFTGGGVGFFAGVATALSFVKPAAGAPPEDNLAYLIQLLEALLTADGTIISLLGEIKEALGAGGPPGVEVTVNTRWVAKDPEVIFTQPIRNAGVFISDMMVNWTEGKRLLLKAESSLNQAVQLQPFGNIDNTNNLATNIGPPVACPAGGNASIGMAWGDWMPYIGMQITVALAPTDGILTIRAVIQE